MDTSSQQQIKWHTKILPRLTKKALEYLALQTWIQNSNWYLAGGTALAIQVGHRSSVDLDFFTEEKDFSSIKIIEKMPKESWITDIDRECTLYGRLNEAKVSFIAYPFFKPKQNFIQFTNIPVLDKKDIAVMKIIALSQRGRKRDFVDLFYYCRHFESLTQIFNLLPVQYPNTAHNYHHILKSLTYFDDADNDPMPELFFRATWKEIKTFFQTEIPRLARQLLRL